MASFSAELDTLKLLSAWISVEKWILLCKKKTKKNLPLAECQTIHSKIIVEGRESRGLSAKQIANVFVNSLAKKYTQLLLLPSNIFSSLVYFGSPVDILLVKFSQFCKSDTRERTRPMHLNVTFLACMFIVNLSLENHFFLLSITHPVSSRWITISCRCLLLAARGNRTKHKLREYYFCTQMISRKKEFAKRRRRRQMTGWTLIKKIEFIEKKISDFLFISFPHAKDYKLQNE